ncbi:MAG: hypothetical protein Q8936_21310 [Bacillota bacterium]|nr:hypothetical protein [Bacillota bacterium]
MSSEFQYMYPYYKDSWTLVSDKIAEKHVDKSVFKYFQTGIPKEITSFFEINTLGDDSKIQITLIHSNNVYDAVIYIDPKKRAKLLFGKELGSIINKRLTSWSEYFVNKDCTTNEISERPYIRLIKISGIRYNIELTIK